MHTFFQEYYREVKYKQLRSRFELGSPTPFPTNSVSFSHDNASSLKERIFYIDTSCTPFKNSPPVTSSSSYRGWVYTFVELLETAFCFIWSFFFNMKILGFMPAVLVSGSRVHFEKINVKLVDIMFEIEWEREREREMWRRSRERCTSRERERERDVEKLREKERDM